MIIPPYNVLIAITKSDTVNFRSDAKPCEAIYVGGSGDMVVVSPNGATVTMTGVVGGAIYPVSAIRVNSASTTATAMMACYTN